MKRVKLRTLFDLVILPLCVIGVIACTSSKDANPTAPASEPQTAVEQEVAAQNGAKNVIVINLLLE